jgi:hypothetical protein
LQIAPPKSIPHLLSVLGAVFEGLGVAIDFRIDVDLMVGGLRVRVRGFLDIELFGFLPKEGQWPLIGSQNLNMLGYV